MGKAKVKTKPGSASGPKRVDLRVANITVDMAIQPRANGLDQSHVQDLMEALTGGAKLPALVVYRTPAGEHILSEGFHRFEAYRRKGSTHVPAEVREGSREDAALNAMGSNKEHHALKRTNADKRRAVAEVLKACPKWSDRKIADHVGVGHDMVADCRRQLADSASSGTRVGSDGKERKLPEKAKPQEVVAARPDEKPEGGVETQQGAPAPSPAPSATANPAPAYEPKPGEVECEHCSGTGNDISGKPCPACNGTGWWDDVPEELPATKGVLDKYKRPVPDAISLAFEDAKLLRGLQVRLGQLFQELAAVVRDSPAGAAVPIQSIEIELSKCQQDLAGALPWVVCPSCDALNPECKVCGGMVGNRKISARGWLPKCRYDQLTPDLKIVCEGPWDAR